MHERSHLPRGRHASMHEPEPPSMWKEGDRLRWRIENSLSHKSTLHTRSHPCHCTANQLCATLYCLTNQLDPPAITHRYRGTPSFRERGLFRASPTAFFHEQFATRLHFPKPPSMWKEGDRLRWRIENSLSH